MQSACLKRAPRGISIVEPNKRWKFNGMDFRSRYEHGIILKYYSRLIVLLDISRFVQDDCVIYIIVHESGSCLVILQYECVI